MYGERFARRDLSIDFEIEPETVQKQRIPHVSLHDIDRILRENERVGVAQDLLLKAVCRVLQPQFLGPRQRLEAAFVLFFEYTLYVPLESLLMGILQYLESLTYRLVHQEAFSLLRVLGLLVADGLD